MKTLSRWLVQAALLVGLAFAGGLLAAEPIPPSHRVGGFVVGVQAYTFNRFTVMEAIEKTEQAGAKVIEFYPGQRLSAEEPKLKWDHHATEDIIQKVKEKLAQHQILPVNYGVVGIPNNEAGARKVFEFAKKMDMPAITTESVEALDLIEKLAKEYGIKVGIHQHARKQRDPNYKLWDPHHVLSLVKDRDARIGACADTGHWATSGLKPLECLQILKGRIISVHLKDKSAFGTRGHDVPYGRGVSDIKGLLDELRQQKFDGNISIEYEYNWDHSVPDVAQCVGFIRGCAAP